MIYNKNISKIVRTPDVTNRCASARRGGATTSLMALSVILSVIAGAIHRNGQYQNLELENAESSVNTTTTVAIAPSQGVELSNEDINIILKELNNSESSGSQFVDNSWQLSRLTFAGGVLAFAFAKDPKCIFCMPLRVLLSIIMDPRIVAALSASIVFGEGKGVKDLPYVIENAFNLNLVPLSKDLAIQDVGQTTEAELTFQDFIKMLSDSLNNEPSQSEQQKQQELKDRLWGLWPKNFHLFLNNFVAPNLASLEKNVFAFDCLKNTLLSYEQAKQKLKEMINPEKKEMTEDDVKTRIRELYENEDERKNVLKLFEEIIKQKKQEGKVINNEELFVEVMLSALITSVVFAVAIGTILELYSRAQQGKTVDVERDPENNKSYTGCLDFKKPTPSGIIDDAENFSTISKAFYRFIHGNFVGKEDGLLAVCEGLKEMFARLATMSGIAIFASPILALLTSAEIPLEYFFGADPENTIDQVHVIAGIGSMPKYSAGIVAYMFAVKAKIIEHENQIMESIAKDDFDLDDFEKLIEDGCLNPTTILMKYRLAKKNNELGQSLPDDTENTQQESLTGSDEFKTAFDLLLAKLPEDKKNEACQFIREKFSLQTDCFNSTQLAEAIEKRRSEESYQKKLAQSIEKIGNALNGLCRRPENAAGDSGSDIDQAMPLNTIQNAVGNGIVSVFGNGIVSARQIALA